MKSNTFVSVSFSLCLFLQNQDFLLHMPVGNGGLSQDTSGPNARLIIGAPTLPTPDLSTPLSADTVCGCEACSERRLIFPVFRITPFIQ